MYHGMQELIFDLKQPVKHVLAYKIHYSMHNLLE